jgi:phospholipase/carboxylesterase
VFLAPFPGKAEGRTLGSVDDPGDDEVRYLRAAFEVARVSRRFLDWMDVAAEKLAPGRSDALAAEIASELAPEIVRARAALDLAPPPPDLRRYADHLAAAFSHVEQATALFAGHPQAPPPARIGLILEALHERARAEDGFYSLRRAAPPFAGYWQLPDTAVDDRPARAAGPEGPGTGVIHVSPGEHHGGFALFVPEVYAVDRSWPVVVALHGGSGNGPDFLWTWLREAKSRGYLLVAPSAVGSTWGPLEDRGLLEILAWLRARYAVDTGRVLLTGLSDGATFTLVYGLAHPDVYRALAPLCGVLHPVNEPLGNLDRARGVPIYLVHGALDFLFPVATARAAHDELARAGAAVEYRELPELSHTYPRSENVRILDWFEALPAGPPVRRA